jgi:phosphoglycerate dehydrogenase-like enzyme
MPTHTLHVYIEEDLSPEQEARLHAVAPGAVLHPYSDSDDLGDDIANADVVAGPLSEAAFQKATKLKWLHSWLAGPNEQLFQNLIESDVPFTCSKGNGAIPLAEHVMMLMLMLNRQAMRWVDSQNRRNWERFSHPELNGLTVGLIGVGNSGVDLAEKCKAFHMRVIGLRRHQSDAPNVDRFYSRAELTEFLGECDFVVVTAPNTPETADMLGEAEFRAMKSSAYYICISRGGIANDAALLKAITDEWIAGAGLDAHGTEPLPQGSVFWTLPNTIITPHNGATTPQTAERGFDIFEQNLRRFVEGQELTNLVNKSAGY